MDVATLEACQPLGSHSARGMVLAKFDPQRTGVSGGGDYSVALTKAGQIAVLQFDDDGEIVSMNVHENFEEFKAATMDGTPSYPLYPDALIQAVASEMDIEHIEELDILKASGSRQAKQKADR